MSARIFGRIVSYIVLVLIAIIGAAPFIYLLILSFKSRLDIIIEVPPTLHFNWATIKENYSTVIDEGHYLTYVKNSIIVTVSRQRSALCSACPPPTPSHDYGSAGPTPGRRRSSASASCRPSPSRSPSS
jgi:ABC-type glycerol-3-phosphate transport system permease component